ncbi:MAG TPA: RDD family protein [Methylomirabilota bacterium]|nr:RDD family protein [Methylomirabilota bacterium]
MQCPNCKGSLHPSEARCPHCGAERAPRRIVFGGKHEDFALTPEEDSLELDSTPEGEDWHLASAERPESNRYSAAIAQTAKQTVRWGGFFRRLFAFLIDAVIVVLLAIVMGVLSYIGYKVGLAGYGRSITWENSPPLIAILTGGWVSLATGYFVMFHGMEGKTIGKWLLGLRVVGAEQRSITYQRAFLRWLGTIVLFPLLLSFLWVLWSREKRGWHDFLARTWVIRD